MVSSVDSGSCCVIIRPRNCHRRTSGPQFPLEYADAVSGRIFSLHMGVDGWVVASIQWIGGQKDSQIDSV